MPSRSRKRVKGRERIVQRAQEEAEKRPNFLQLVAR